MRRISFLPALTSLVWLGAVGGAGGAYAGEPAPAAPAPAPKPTAVVDPECRSEFQATADAMAIAINSGDVNKIGAFADAQYVPKYATSGTSAADLLQFWGPDVDHTRKFYAHCTIVTLKPRVHAKDEFSLADESGMMTCDAKLVNTKWVLGNCIFNDGN